MVFMALHSRVRVAPEVAVEKYDDSKLEDGADVQHFPQLPITVMDWTALLGVGRRALGPAAAGANCPWLNSASR